MIISDKRGNIYKLINKCGEHPMWTTKVLKERKKKKKQIKISLDYYNKAQTNRLDSVQIEKSLPCFHYFKQYRKEALKEQILI